MLIDSTGVAARERSCADAAVVHLQAVAVVSGRRVWLQHRDSDSERKRACRGIRSGLAHLHAPAMLLLERLQLTLRDMDMR